MLENYLAAVLLSLFWPVRVISGEPVVLSSISNFRSIVHAPLPHETICPSGYEPIRYYESADHKAKMFEASV